MFHYAGTPSIESISILKWINPQIKSKPFVIANLLPFINCMIIKRNSEILLALLEISVFRPGTEGWLHRSSGDSARTAIATKLQTPIN
jgi:hypothetical protein